MDDQSHLYFGRGLSQDQMELIRKRLPDTRTFRAAVLDYEPSMIAMVCEPGQGRDNVPAAAVCLQDASLALMEAEYGLGQALVALEAWANQPSCQVIRVAQAQYYAADVAHRVYATGEHLSTAIVMMLGIPRSALEKGKQISLQIKVRNYLKSQLPNHAVTAAVLPLGDSDAFKRTIDYRGDWVHDQPRRLSGLGITYDRHAPRWSPLTNAQGTVIGHGLHGGGGDPATESIDAVVDDAVAAVTALVTASMGVLHAYDEILSACGVQVDHVAGKISIGGAHIDA